MVRLEKEKEKSVVLGLCFFLKRVNNTPEEICEAY